NYHMKRFLIFGMVVSFSVAFNSRAAQTAQARIYCQSLRFQQGVYHGLAGDTTLDLSTINQNNLGDPAFPKNGELAPTFSDPDHFSGFVLYDTLLDDVVLVGEIDLNTAIFADVNGNGFEDFLDVTEDGSAA